METLSDLKAKFPEVDFYGWFVDPATSWAQVVERDQDYPLSILCVWPDGTDTYATASVDRVFRGWYEVSVFVGVHFLGDRSLTGVLLLLRQETVGPMGYDRSHYYQNPGRSGRGPTGLFYRVFFVQETDAVYARMVLG